MAVNLTWLDLIFALDECLEEYIEVSAFTWLSDDVIVRDPDPRFFEGPDIISYNLQAGFFIKYNICGS